MKGEKGCRIFNQTRWSLLTLYFCSMAAGLHQDIAINGSWTVQFNNAVSSHIDLPQWRGKIATSDCYHFVWGQNRVIRRIIGLSTVAVRRVRADGDGRGPPRISTQRSLDFGPGGRNKCIGTSVMRTPQRCPQSASLQRLLPSEMGEWQQDINNIGKASICVAAIQCPP